MKEMMYHAKEPWVKYLGRTLFLEDTLWCALSGSGIAFKVKGTCARILLAGDDKTRRQESDKKKDEAIQDEGYARIAIYVNDKRVVDDCLTVPEKTYEIFCSKQEQEALVRVVKLSEAPMSLMGIKGIFVNEGAKVTPLEASPLKIEFIGDSITCGYGVDDENEEHHFSTATEDVTCSYAYLTAEQLSADYSMVSYSGHGIISGYTETDEKLLSELVPPFYPMVGHSFGLVGNKAVTEEAWDFTRFRPNVVVINLGTNDDSYCKDVKERQEEFASEYASFLEKVRQKNPDAFLLCAYGIMTDRLFPYIEKAAALYREKTKDARIDTLLLTTHVAADGYAADWHPSKKSHRKAAAELTAYLKELRVE